MDRNYYLVICLTMFLHNTVNAMDSEAQRTQINMERPDFSGISNEMKVDIDVDLLSLDNDGLIVAYALCDFFRVVERLNEKNVSVNFLVYDFLSCMETILPTKWKGLMLIWNSKIPKDHALRRAIIDYIKTKKEKIFNESKIFYINRMLIQVYSMCFDWDEEDLLYKLERFELTKEVFLWLKFLIETDIMPKNDKLNILEWIDYCLEQCSPFRSPTLSFLASIIRANRIGFNKFNYAYNIAKETEVGPRRLNYFFGKRKKNDPVSTSKL